MKAKQIYLALMLIMLICTGCANKKLEPVVPVPATPPCELLPGASTSLTAKGGEGAVTFEWYASAGQLTPNRGPTVTFTAPQNYSGAVNIMVVAKNNASQEQGEITCNILALPTSTPTPTLAPTATLSPTPTITPTPPPPLLEIFPQVEKGKEFVFNNNGVLTNLFLPNENCIHSGVYGLQITWNMQGQGNGGWGVQWSSSLIGHFDASSFNTFTFWVKGASGGETFQIGLKDTTGNNGQGYEVKLGSRDFVVITRDWTPVTVPLSEFKEVNTASLENINLGFNKDHGSGSICVDDFAFVSE